MSGELTLREYQANDGTMKTSLDVNATTIDLVGKREDKYDSQPPVISAPTTGQDKYGYSSTNSELKYPENGAPYSDDDDIPF